MTPPKVPGGMGSDARSAPPTGDTTNESTSAAQRAPDLKSDLDSGPKVNDANGAYGTARYKTRDREVALSNGRVITQPGNIREDR